MVLDQQPVRSKPNYVIVIEELGIEIEMYNTFSQQDIDDYMF